MFDSLLPLAVQWAESQEANILQNGIPLSQQGISDAKLAGVAYPDRIRLLKVDRIPIPENPILKQAAEITGLISPGTRGMALRYGIFVHRDCWGDRDLMAHEFVHTSQYEKLGGFREFLERYLRECIEIGYPEAPMEQEAVKGAKKIYG
ncbi:MAG: hypothetical protein ACYSYM_12615 [Planctomycetota bacterium]